jgi:hypothetical protein
MNQQRKEGLAGLLVILWSAFPHLGNKLRARIPGERAPQDGREHIASTGAITVLAEVLDYAATAQWIPPYLGTALSYVRQRDFSTAKEVMRNGFQSAQLVVNLQSAGNTMVTIFNGVLTLPLRGALSWLSNCSDIGTAVIEAQNKMTIDTAAEAFVQQVLEQGRMIASTRRLVAAR